ncbi:Hypothetical protein SRAE_2000118300 [Strongyloides ratti]|uniref:Uncharacterized protein n=1 Tax=Strongyloides ratti TaxID=34506 RepID=A0A090LG67_STRRB|nr:Hypothetical protein SRAE_2000118300 [Strongyloides ratti]CEF66515.1 Hypothetical protein SRAE_2000118300 [Strongyloides ratti]
MKYGKKVMDMSKEELYLVYSAISKLKYPKLDVDDVQEIIIKWLLENKLSIKHIFFFYQDEEESFPHIYLLSRNSEVPCQCCSITPTSYQEFRQEKNKAIINSTKKEFLEEKKDNLMKEPIKTDVNNVPKQQREKKSDIVLSPNELIKINENNTITKSGNTTKITAVTEQPKVGEHLKNINIEKEKNNKNNNGCCMWCRNFCTTCKAEFGKCCIDIMGNI